MDKRVLVGLSGGIDSFMTALLLKKRGYEVVGLNLLLWREETDEPLAALCRRLGIPLQYYDGRALFRERIVKSFIQDYLQGRTPNPCTLCNATVKWELLCRAADEQGIGKIATGHYVRIRQEGQHFYVFKGKDPVKDQSYFLWGIKEELLARTLTPLGEYTKAEIRQLAVEEGYEWLVQKKESMGVCFLQGGNYREFVALQAGVKIEMGGPICNIRGEIIGRHTGLLNYTVGQKRGIPSEDGQALYVAELRPDKNEIVVDRKEKLFRTILEISSIHFVKEEDLEQGGVEVKVRGLGQNPAGEAWVYRMENGNLRICLSSPAWALAPGQPVVLYRQERLLGGGILVACPEQ